MNSCQIGIRGSCFDQLVENHPEPQAINMTINIHPKAVVALAACLAIHATPALAEPGDLDPTFGTGGKVTTSIGSSNDRVGGLAVQSDGKLLVE